MFHISANISTFGFIFVVLLGSLPHTINTGIDRKSVCTINIGITWDFYAIYKQPCREMWENSYYCTAQMR